ncbi:hypothetical protein B0J13DRAFT_284189 [Dactylonectria estremocensis]|uniref:Uncharacterized protein n=1 Tax=Dactylonectria estremocensis TaxID=1079267 RepID=A0A9P9F205_9HYPO|nr:hypothetical protein B0J13DRAFT_284189 [Dactylonectria estremocensis]
MNPIVRSSPDLSTPLSSQGTSETNYFNLLSRPLPLPFASLSLPSRRFRDTSVNTFSSANTAPRPSGDGPNPTSDGSAPNLAIDPPRAAGDGLEWVWFPEGYWAERELLMPRKSTNSNRF